MTMLTLKPAAPWRRFLTDLWRRLAEPHPSITEIGQRRAAQLLAALTLGYAVLILLSLIATAGGPLNLALLISLGLAAAAYVLARTRYYRIGSYLFVVSLALSAYVDVFLDRTADISGALNAFIPIAFVIGSALLGVWSLGAVVLLNFIAILALPAAFPAYTDAFANAGVLLSLGALLMLVVAYRDSVERARLEEVRKINTELRALQSTLEARVAERTKALATSAEVSRRLSTLLEMRDLIPAVVEQIRSAFDYYHVHVYLLDATRGTLVMAGGTGAAGQTMLQRGHSVPLERGLVGRAARTNSVVLVPDTAREPGWLPNPLLPDTRAEVAVPIALGGRVLGVLDVQQNRVNSLGHSDADLLQSVANQVAVALQNAQQYGQTESAMESAARRAERERLLNRISARVRGATSMEQMVQIAAEELQSATRARGSEVWVAPAEPATDR